MAAKGYTTKEAVENYLQITIDDAFDEQIDEWIETVEEYIDSVTDRDFTPYDGSAAASQRTFDGAGDRTLVIDPCTQVTAVRFSESGTAIDADQYVTTPIRKDTITGLKMKYLNLPCGIQNIYVTAKWGFKDVPKQIKMVATMLVGGIINESWQSEGEVQSVTLGRYQVTYKSVADEAAKHPEVDEMLQHLKRYTF